MDDIEYDFFMNKLREDPSSHRLVWEWIWELTTVAEQRRTQLENERTHAQEHKGKLEQAEEDIETMQQGYDLRTEELKAKEEQLSNALDRINTLQDQLTIALRQSPAETPAPADSKSSGKSSKIPDPEVFSTGNHDDWEVFKIQLHDKLAVNEDHFRNEQAKIAYVRTRLGGEALQIALPTSRAPGATASSIIHALDSRFADPVAKETARDNYNSLYMGSKEFPAFLGLFQKYAAIAEIPQYQQIEDLRRKTTPKVQEALAGFDFSNLSDLISRMHNITRRLNQATAIRNRNEAASNRRNVAGNSSAHTTNNDKPQNNASARNRPPSTAPPPTGSSRPPAQPTQQAPPVDKYTRGCLNCGKPGHYARECPHEHLPGFAERWSAMQTRRNTRPQQMAPVELAASEEHAQQGNESSTPESR